MLLDNSTGKDAVSLLFEHPLEIIRADHPGEVDAALEALSAGIGRGLHAAGFFSYELGYVLEPKLAGLKTPVVKFVYQAQRILVYVSIADLTLRVPVDKYGIALWKPTEREVLPYDCAQCSLVETCKVLPTTTAWSTR